MTIKCGVQVWDSLVIEDDVFMQVQTRDGEGFTEDVKAFIDELSTKRSGTSFGENLTTIMKRGNASDAVQSITTKILAEATECA